MNIRYLLLGILPLVLAACSPGGQNAAKSAPVSGEKSTSPAAEQNFRQWYAFDQTSRGYDLYQANCAACHGKQGEGAVNWQQPGPDGKYPPPPLNGTGHAWHHPMRALAYTIKKGSPGGNGNMPAWEGKLTQDDILDIMAWFQSSWSNQIYQAWARNDANSRAKKQG